MSTTMIGPVPSYHQYLDSAVFQCCVMWHPPLPSQTGRDNENQVRLYLLVGANKAVCISIRPRTVSDFTIKAVFSGLALTSVTGCVGYVTFTARGCPNNFNPAAQLQRPQDSLHVAQFLAFVTQARWSNFQFTDLEGQAFGCRMWMQMVVEGLCQANYLYAGDDFETFQDYMIREWGTDIDGMPTPIVPGLFLSPPSGPISGLDAFTLFSRAEKYAIHHLVEVLYQRDRSIWQKYHDYQSTNANVKSRGLTEIWRSATRMGVEVARARQFAYVPTAVTFSLRDALPSGLLSARAALSEANDLRGDGYGQAEAADIFTLYLTAVCDMYGRPHRRINPTQQR